MDSELELILRRVVAAIQGFTFAWLTEADMMQLVGALIFAGAFGVSVATIVGMVAPQWQRIVRLAAGQPEEAFAPLRSLVQAERRIAVRRWAAVPASASARTEWRAAA